MKIAELEAHHDAYVSSEDTIRTMVDNRKFPAVFSFCIQSFPHIVPAIQFRKKREIVPEIPTPLAFTTICRYAPPLFEHAAIESLREFIKSTRILAQHENNFSSAIDAAHNREKAAQTLWNHLEKEPGALQHDTRTQLGIVQDDAIKIIELWEELGVIDRQQEDGDHRLFIHTRLDSEMEGLCHGCGVRGRGRKDTFFKSRKCGRCGTEGYYHIEYSDTQ